VDTCVFYQPSPLLENTLFNPLGNLVYSLVSPSKIIEAHRID
jgi:hypothetical protein